MIFEIAINDRENESGNEAYVMLPANKNEVIDALDRAKIFGDFTVSISECDGIPELNNAQFSEEPTLDELNFLAKRLNEVAADEQGKTQIIAYRALLQRGVGTINEAINRTYNLETILVYPCKNVYAYGEIVLENEMLEELSAVPDEVCDWLDPDKVGRAMMEREGGVFIDEYYAAANSYDPVLVYDEELPEPQEDWVFRLEIAGVPEKPEDISKMETEILALPADEKDMQEIAEKLGEKHIDECVLMRFDSAIPQIDCSAIESMEDIYALNDIAWKFSELSRADAVKFKAVLCKEQPDNLDDVEDILNSQDQYEVDVAIKHYSEFGSKYLSKILPREFDRSLLRGACTAEFAQKIMCANNCTINEYGVVSERGGHLYSMAEAPDQEQISDFKMGGIS